MERNYTDFIIVNGEEQYPDYVLFLHHNHEDFEIKNCLCIFANIDKERTLSWRREVLKYLWAKKFDVLTLDIAVKLLKAKQDGQYNFDTIFCFTETEFPLDDFLEENGIELFE